MPIPSRETALVLLLAFAVLIPAGRLARAKVPTSPPLCIRAEWTYYEGWLHRSGDLEFRMIGPRLASLRWTWPRMSMLPEAQCLLFDGGELLAWSEPADREALLDPKSRRLAPLKELGAGFMLAFLRGEGLERFFEQGSLGQWRGWTLDEGLLGGSPALLRRSGSRARSLRWSRPEGDLNCRWESELSGRRLRLDIRMEGGGKLVIRSRPPEARSIEPQDLFFP